MSQVEMAGSKQWSSGRVTLRRGEVRGEESKEENRVRQQEEPSEMNAVIKRLASDEYGGISQLLPATG